MVVVRSFYSGEERGRYHYTSEGRHIRIFVQLLSSVDESDLNLHAYFSTNGAFIVKYEGKQYFIFDKFSNSSISLFLMRQPYMLSILWKFNFFMGAFLFTITELSLIHI